MKFGWQDFSADVDLTPMFFRCASWLRTFLFPDPLRRLPEPIGLISSRLLAVREGTTFQGEGGSWKAAPLLKPLADGTALPIRSGFLVSGLYDVFGQLAVAQALGRIGRSFTLMD